MIPKETVKLAVAQLCNNKGRLHALTVEDMHNVAKTFAATPISKDAIRGLIRYLIKQKNLETGRAPVTSSCTFFL